ncbi:hypothetical protein APHAL10511_000816 [Amanita phalloides]|nr:hypothetical protein APHAL10511_000816 [Amanita phalloides]
MNQSNDITCPDFFAGNNGENKLLFLLDVALGLQNGHILAPMMPPVMPPGHEFIMAYSMEAVEPQIMNEDSVPVRGTRMDPGSAAVHPAPAKFGGDVDPWINGYITDSGRKVVPVEKFTSPPLSLASRRSRRGIKSVGKSSRRHHRGSPEIKYKCPACETIYYDDETLASHLHDVPDCREVAGPPETWGARLREFRLMTYATPRRRLAALACHER